MSAVSPGGAGESLPTPTEIENWPTQHLADAAQAWRTAAGKSTNAFEQHRRNIANPGGTEWEGTAKDAALGRVDGDIRVAGYHGDVLTESASAAEDGLTSVKAAKREAVAALKEATDDGFTVADDLSVTDARRYDINTIVERNTAAKEHAENVRWTAERLVQADAFVGQRLRAKAAELHQLRFEGEGDQHPTVQLVDHHFKQDNGSGEQPVPDPAPRVRGLPPADVRPPVEGPLTEGPPSRAREGRFGGRSLWDGHGGEWRYAPEDDHHNPHWDYNPHSTPSGRGSDWENIPIGGLPPRKGENPVISALPPWLQSPAVQGAPVPGQNPLLAPFPGASMPAAPPVSSPAPGPGLMPHVNIPAPTPGDLQTAGGQVAVVGGGGLLLALLGAMALG